MTPQRRRGPSSTPPPAAARGTGAAGRSPPPKPPRRAAPPHRAPIHHTQQINTQTASTGHWLPHSKPEWKESEEAARYLLALLLALIVVPGIREAIKVTKRILDKPTEFRWLILLVAVRRKAITAIGRILVWGIVFLCAEMAFLTLVCAWFAEDPPDPDIREVYRPDYYELPPAVPSETIPQQISAAFDAALQSQLDSLSLCVAELVSLERYQGARAAGDDEAAGRQLVAQVNYTIEAAQALARAARLIEEFAAVWRAGGQPDVVVTADQVRTAQEQLASDGFPDELLAVFAWLGFSEELLNEQILPAAMSVDPDKAAGGFQEMLLQQAALYRRVSALLTGSPPRACWVGNPHDREETIDLFIQPISMPPGWKVTIVNAGQSEDAAQDRPGRAGPEFPVREIEAGKNYAVTLPAHRQVKLLTTLVPAGEVGARATTRWAIEGKIGDELLGGVLHEMTVP